MTESEKYQLTDLGEALAVVDQQDVEWLSSLDEQQREYVSAIFGSLAALSVDFDAMPQFQNAPTVTQGEIDWLQAKWAISSQVPPMTDAAYALMRLQLAEQDPNHTGEGLERLHEVLEREETA